MVRVNLNKNKKRPTIPLDSSAGKLDCLIDTGALVSVWCLPLFILKTCYPAAEKTNYRTTISGFGGISYKKRDIWKIPEFVLEDKNGEGRYTVKNLLIAVADDTQITSFNMILSSLVFHGSSYQIFDKASDKHLEIYSEHDRPVVCIPGETIDKNVLDDSVLKSLDLTEDEIFISGITVFADEG